MLNLMTKMIKMNNTKSFSAVYKYTVPESSLNTLLSDKRFKDRNSYSEISRKNLDQLYGFIKNLLRKKTRVDGNRILLTESQYNRLKWNALSPIGVRRYVPPVNPDSEIDEENFYVIWIDEDGLFRYYGVPNMKEAKKLHDNFKSKISSGEVFNKLDIITKSELGRYENDIKHTKNKEMNTKTFSIKGSKSFSSTSNPFRDVIQSIKKEFPKAKISIKSLKESKAPWGDLIRNYLVTVDKYKFYFEAYDFNHDTRNQLLRTIGSILDQGKNFEKNPEFKTKRFSSDKIESEDEFRDYAHNLMKNAHGDDYSEEVTNKVVDDLIKDNPDADYGELIGRLTSGLGD